MQTPLVSVAIPKITAPGQRPMPERVKYQAELERIKQDTAVRVLCLSLFGVQPIDAANAPLTVRPTVGSVRHAVRAAYIAGRTGNLGSPPAKARRTV